MIKKMLKTFLRIIIALAEIALGLVSLYVLHHVFVTNIAPGGARISSVIELFYMKDYVSILLFSALAVIPLLTLLAGVGLLMGTNWGKGLSICCAIFWIGLLCAYSYFILPKETSPSGIKIYEQLSIQLRQWWESFLNLKISF